MNEITFHQCVRRAYEFYTRNELLRQVSTLSSFRPTDHFKKLCFDNTIRYSELFMAGLEESQFNFQLLDYSFFQFSRFHQSSIRYAFYPSPFDVESLDEISELDTYLQGGLLTFEDFSQEVQGKALEQRRPLIRYEYNEEQHRLYHHPASHLHFGLHDDNRFAVERLLTPSTFALVVAKQFYGNSWANQGAEQLEDGSAIGQFDKMLIQEKHSSSIVAAQFFSMHERRLPYIG